MFNISLAFRTELFIQNFYLNVINYKLTEIFVDLSIFWKAEETKTDVRSGKNLRVSSFIYILNAQKTGKERGDGRISEGGKSVNTRNHLNTWGRL